jgi:HEAT repeat protein
MATFDRLSFEDKLLNAAFHPIPENRAMAVEALGMLGSTRALPVLARILAEEKEDVYLIYQALEALARIPDPRSRQLLTGALHHPFRLVREKARELLEHTPDQGMAA